MKISFISGSAILSLAFTFGMQASEQSESKVAAEHQLAESSVIRELAEVGFLPTSCIAIVIRETDIPEDLAQKRKELYDTYLVKFINSANPYSYNRYNDQYNPLERAVNEGNTELVREYLSYPINPNTVDPWSWSRCFKSSLRSSTLEIFALLLERSRGEDAYAAHFAIDPCTVARSTEVEGGLETVLAYCKKYNDYTPLHEALYECTHLSQNFIGSEDKRVQYAEALIKAGADLNHFKKKYVKNDLGSSPISYYPYPDDPKYKEHRSTALMTAVEGAQIVASLAIKNAYATQEQLGKMQSFAGKLPSFADVINQENIYLSLAKLLIQNDADPFVLNHDGQMAIDHINFQRKLQHVCIPLMKILTAKADQAMESVSTVYFIPVLGRLIGEYAGFYGNQYLLAYACMGNNQKVAYGLSTGMDVQTKNGFNKTMLHWAAENGDNAMIELLLKYRADVNAQETHGFTPLMLAAERGHLESVKLLLAAGANPNKQSTFNSKNRGRRKGERRYRGTQEDGYISIDEVAGTTALMLAALESNLPVVEYLRNHGADVNLVNDEGKTALDLLQENTIPVK